MRVTTQMLNDSARRAGLPVNSTSLLTYVNGKGGGSGTLLNALKSRTTGQTRPADRARYEKLERAADNLGRQADKFTAEGEKSLFGKAKESGDYTEVYREIGSLVDQYNSTISILESVPGAMNDFYRRSMQELASDNKEALDSLGISFDKRGKLQVDQEKLESADRETIEKVFGKEGRFTAKLSYLSGRIEDNAGSNITSASGGYSAKGDITGAYLNRYDYRG